MFAKLKIIPTFAPPLKNKATLKKSFGEVAEWSIAAVLKTVVPRGTRGSNPCLSAKHWKSVNFKNYTQLYTLQCKAGCFVFQSSNL